MTMEQPKLPERYLMVTAIPNKIGPKKIFFGIIDKEYKRVALYLFGKETVMEYTRDEVKEYFDLYNPEDGFQYDLKKLFGEE